LILGNCLFPYEAVTIDMPPPFYNVEDGRKGCLTTFEEPSTWEHYFSYFTYCAEATDESNGYEPKIKVRSQKCSFGHCWTNQKTLKWGGQCVVWPSNYGFPGDRFCARLAVRGNQGYTKYKHLNKRGNEQDDPVYRDSDGNEFRLDLPKLCAYYDPSLIQTSLYDLIDAKLFSSPYHYTTETNPIADAILTSLVNNLPISLLVDTIFRLSGGENLGEEYKATITVSLGVLATIFTGGVGPLLAVGLEQALKHGIPELQKSLYLNKMVFDQLGCVNVPLKPGPRKYCPFLTKPQSTAQVQSICRTLTDGTIERSTLENPCATSTIQNNLIRNTIRVSYDQLVPLCQGDENSFIDTSCVKINFGTSYNALAAKRVHLSTSNTGFIDRCDTTRELAEQPLCVQTGITQPSGKPFRLVYGLRSEGPSSQARPLESITFDQPDCSDNPNWVCQKIWGINAGDYEDISVSFPLVEGSYSTTASTNSATIIDLDGMGKNFQASVVRQETEYDSGFTQSPNQICVFEDGDTSKILGCKDRLQTLPKPIVRGCDGVECTSTFFQPKIVVELRSGNDSTKGVIEVANRTNAAAVSKVNLAGFDYSAFATDDNYNKIPFASLPAKSTDTLFGNYSPSGVEPVDSNGNRNTSLTYLNGLEYINGKYSLGGTKTCLTGFNVESCATNIRNCALAKLDKKDTVSCKSFFDDYLYGSFPGLRLCASNENTCTIVGNIPRKDGGNPIKVRDCGSSGIPTCSNGAPTCNTGTPKCSNNGDLACVNGVLTCTSGTPICSTSIIKSFCYEHDEYLCTSTLKPSDRVYPAYNGPGTETLAENEYLHYAYLQQNDNSVLVYYNPPPPPNSAPNTTPITVNKDTQIIRDKTEVEHGLCVEVPPAKCSAIDESAGANEENGFASWAEAPVGTEVTGTCITNYAQTADKPVKRNCSIDFSSGTPQAKFGALINGYKCAAAIVSLDISGVDNQSATALTMGTVNQVSVGSQTAASQDFTVSYTFPVANNTEANSYREFVIKVVIPDKTKIASFNLKTASFRASADMVSVNNNLVRYRSCSSDGCIKGAGYSFQDTYADNSNLNLVPNLINGDNFIKIQVNKGKEFMYADGDGEFTITFNYNLYQ
jgi:hypothetical protein